MKPLTLTLAAAALLGLSACNTQQAGNEATDNAANATDNAALTENVTDNGSTAAGDKPIDGTGNEAAAPAGDKPADNATEASSNDEAEGDKPTE